MFPVLNILKNSISLINHSASFSSMPTDHAITEFVKFLDTLEKENQIEALKEFRNSIYYRAVLLVFRSELGSLPDYINVLAKKHPNLQFIVKFILNDSFDKGIYWNYPAYNPYGIELSVEDLLVLSFKMYSEKVDRSNFNSFRLECGFGFGYPK